MPTPLLFLAAVLIWGSTFLVITFQLGDVAPAISVFLRFALGSAMLFAWCLARHETIWITWRRQPWLMLQGLLNFGLSYVCTYHAENYLVSALVAVLFALMVFWNALGARLCFGTRLGWHTLCAAAVAMCGVVMLFSQALTDAWHAAGSQAGGNAGFLLGLLLAVVATLSSSAGNMVAVMVGRKHDNNVFVTTAWAMGWGALSVGIYALATGQSWHLPASPVYWSAMLYLALCGSVIAFTCYFTLINRIGPGKAAYTGVLTPVVSVLLSMRFEHYQPGAVGFAGMALCLAGVVWAISGKSAPLRLRAVRPSESDCPASTG